MTSSSYFFHLAVGDSEIAAAREHGCFTCISCCVWPDLARKAALFLVLLHYAIVGFGCSNLLSSLVISVQIAIFVLVWIDCFLILFGRGKIYSISVLHCVLFHQTCFATEVIGRNCISFRLVALEFPRVSLAVGNFLFIRSGIGMLLVLLEVNMISHGLFSILPVKLTPSPFP